MAKRKRLTPEQRAKREAAQAEKQTTADIRRREAALAEAQRQECIAEHAAPAAVRKPVVQTRIDPTGAVAVTVLRGPRVEVINGRPVRVNQVAGLVGVRGEMLPSFRDVIGGLADRSPCITPAHLTAARKLQDDWSEVGAGIGVKAVDYNGLSGGSGGGGLDTAVLAQAATRARLDAALTWLGALCNIVVPVVLDCVPVSAWAEANAMRTPHAVGYLAAALTRLVGFYDSRSRTPTTEAFTVEVDAQPDGIRSLVTEDVAARTPALGRYCA